MGMAMEFAFNRPPGADNSYRILTAFCRRPLP